MIVMTGIIVITMMTVTINNRDPRYDDNNSRAMNDLDFNHAKASLRKEWFENTRLATAKQIIEQELFHKSAGKEK